MLDPDDLAGLKIRVQPSRTAIETVEALGGSPTPIAFGELYTALAQRLVDGAENNPPSFFTSRHAEVCKHYSLDEHSAVPDMLLIGTRAWDDLPPAAQRVAPGGRRRIGRFRAGALGAGDRRGAGGGRGPGRDDPPPRSIACSPRRSSRCTARTAARRWAS